MLKFLLCLVTILFPVAPSFAQSKQLQVGAVISLTGMAAAHGDAIREGLQFAAKDLAERGAPVTL